MKRHLVVVCGQYYPITSPTAKCAERYVSLFSEELYIDLISESQSGIVEEILTESEIHVHTLTCLRISLEKKTKGIIRKFFHFVGTLLLFTNYLGNQQWYRKAAYKKLEQIHSIYPIDVIFAVCSPLAAQWAGADFKKNHPDVLLCSYTVDPYSTPDRIKPLFHSRESMLNYEKSALRKMDNVLLSEEVYNTRPELYKGIRNCSALPYLMPPFTEDTGKGLYFNRTTLNCLYAGSFYEEIRNPEYMLKVFSCLSETNIVIHLFSKGCESTVSKFLKYKSIVSHGMVPQSSLQEIYSSADVLVGVGNTVLDFFPSKTFEYIAQRKPIVYVNHGNVKNDVLDIHPNVIQLSDSDSIEQSVSRLESFCMQISDELISKDLLLSLYVRYSPSTIKKILSVAFNF